MFGPHSAVNSTSPYGDTADVGKEVDETFGLFEDHRTNVQPGTVGGAEGAFIEFVNTYVGEPPKASVHAPGVCTGQLVFHVTV